MGQYDKTATAMAGPLEGCIGRVEPLCVAGWAVDLDHPELPVTLEIWVQDRLIWLGLRRIATVMTGGAAGRGFICVPPRPIPADMLHTVRVRRASDGAELARGLALHRTMAMA